MRRLVAAMSGLLFTSIALAAPGDPDLHGPAWSGAVDPFRVVGNIYYVGATNIASYLIATPAGHILLDTGTREMMPVVTQSIAKLGFELSDVKVLLAGHAHYDHVGSHAAMQRATGAQVMALGDDAIAIAAGTDRSPLGAEGWDSVPVDRRLKDGDEVSLGGTTLRAVHAPGHTPGCTVWTMRTRDEGTPRPPRDYEVAFHACLGPNLEVELIANAKFPKLVEQTRATFAKLKKLKPDIYLLMHPKEQFAGKVSAIVRGEAPHPLYDPTGWPKLLEEGRTSFEARVRAEREKAKAAPRAAPQSR
jgi:metallo-beta-lactamase class B